ncbi:MAG: alpha-amylase family glycosyl hydrolase, partial [Gammaproteobacteria bacterium]
MHQSDKDWWRNAVIYQIYPRSFLDLNKDGIGDIKGIISKIEYLKSLEVDAIWLSPVFKSPMNDMGYDVSDYFDIDPLFGNMDDFEGLINICHKNGLKLIIDQVYSHTSDEHPFFKQSKKDKENDRADWYVWADPKEDGGPPNNWLSVFGGSAWEWSSKRRQYY